MSWVETLTSGFVQPDGHPMLFIVEVVDEKVDVPQDSGEKNQSSAITKPYFFKVHLQNLIQISPTSTLITRVKNDSNFKI
jgi:hypothetical protein